jgi:uncharacterized membrane protein YphA (DoxX/SURF4 family)
MSVASFRAQQRSSGFRAVLERAKGDPAYQAFLTLRVGFTVLPIVMGIDKFFNNLVNWEQYLAHWILTISPFTATGTMHVVGIIEIAAGILVAIKPRYFAYLVAAWLGGIILDLLTYSGFYDVALRDFGLLLGALSLARLASEFDPPLSLGARH